MHLSKRKNKKRLLKANLAGHGRLHHRDPSTASAEQNIEDVFSYNQMPVPIEEFISKDGQKLSFGGTIQDLLERVSLRKKSDFDNITEVLIAIKGSMVQDKNHCCLYTSFLLGSMCLLPLKIVNSGWFQSRFQDLYETDLSAYRKIGCFIRQYCSLAKSVKILLQDNAISSDKIECLLGQLDELQHEQNISVVNKARAINNTNTICKSQSKTSNTDFCSSISKLAVLKNHNKKTTVTFSWCHEISVSLGKTQIDVIGASNEHKPLLESSLIEDHGHS